MVFASSACWASVWRMEQELVASSPCADSRDEAGSAALAWERAWNKEGWLHRAPVAQGEKARLFQRVGLFSSEPFGAPSEPDDTHAAALTWSVIIPHLQRVATFLVVVLGWVFFRAPDLHHAPAYLAALARVDGPDGLRPHLNPQKPALPPAAAAPPDAHSAPPPAPAPSAPDPGTKPPPRPAQPRHGPTPDTHYSAT